MTRASYPRTTYAKKLWTGSHLHLLRWYQHLHLHLNIDLLVLNRENVEGKTMAIMAITKKEGQANQTI